MEQNNYKNVRQEFMESIKTEVNDELLNLQNKLKNKEIQISELTEEQKDKLIEIYNKQIQEKKQKLEKIKQSILKLKSKKF